MLQQQQDHANSSWYNYFAIWMNLLQNTELHIQNQNRIFGMECLKIFIMVSLFRELTRQQCYVYFVLKFLSSFDDNLTLCSYFLRPIKTLQFESSSVINNKKTQLMKYCM